MKLKLIDKDYLISLNYYISIENGKQYLRKDYCGILLINGKNEIDDLVDISVYLEKYDNKWIISKCLSDDSDRVNVFKTHFKSNNIQELLYFDKLNSK